MPVRKTVEESFVVEGSRDAWLGACDAALRSAGFTKVTASRSLFQVSGAYHKLTVWGTLEATLLPMGSGQTQVSAKATAAADNAYALFRSPGQTMINKFKGALRPPTGLQSAAARGNVPREPVEALVSVHCYKCGTINQVDATSGGTFRCSSCGADNSLPLGPANP